MSNYPRPTGRARRAAIQQANRERHDPRMKAVKAGYAQWATPFERESVEVPSGNPDNEDYSGTPGTTSLFVPRHSSDRVAEAAYFGPEAIEIREKHGHSPDTLGSATAFHALGHAQDIQLRNERYSADPLMFLHKKAIRSLNIQGADEAFVSRAAEHMAKSDPVLMNQRNKEYRSRTSGGQEWLG